MYKLIASTFPLGFPYKDFLKLESVFYDSQIRSRISSMQISNAGVYNFLTEIGNCYPGETYFIGCGNESKWISLNIIEGSDDVFIHTTLKDQKNQNKDVSQTYAQQGFMKNKGNCNLYKVGKISDTEQNLISEVDKITETLN